MPIGYSENEAPCRTRAGINNGSDDVVAASREPARTIASTQSNTRFLLCRSASRPMSGVVAAAPSRRPGP